MPSVNTSANTNRKLTAGDVMNGVGSYHDGVLAAAKSAGVNTKNVSMAYSVGFLGIGIVVATLEDRENPVRGATMGLISGSASWVAAETASSVAASYGLGAALTGVATAVSGFGAGFAVGYIGYKLWEALEKEPTYSYNIEFNSYFTMSTTDIIHTRLLDVGLYENQNPIPVYYAGTNAIAYYTGYTGDNIGLDSPSEHPQPLGYGGFTSSSPSIDHSAKDDPGYSGGKPYSGYGGQNSPSEMSGKGPGMGAGSSGSSVGGSSQDSSGSSHFLQS